MSLKYTKNPIHAPKYIRGYKDIYNKNNYSGNYNNFDNDNKNSALSKITTQLKNIALIDKSKTLEIYNSKFPSNKKYNTPRNIKYFPSNNFIEDSIKLNNNLLNNTNSSNESIINDNNLLNITNISNEKIFQNLEKINSESFTIINIIPSNNTLSDIKKQNIELKENIKFLLKQIKRYQKNGIDIEEVSITDRLKDENNKQKLFYENQIIELKREINLYKNKLKAIAKKYNEKNNRIISDKIQELLNRNNELKNFINSNLSQINLKNGKNQKEEISSIEKKELNEKNCEIVERNKLKKTQQISNEEAEKIEYDMDGNELYDIRGFEEKSLENNLFNNISDKTFSCNSLVSFYSNKILNNVKNYSYFANCYRKKNKSECKLYKRKNIKKSILFDCSNINNQSTNKQYKEYEKLLLKSRISSKPEKNNNTMDKINHNIYKFN